MKHVPNGFFLPATVVVLCIALTVSLGAQESFQAESDSYRVISEVGETHATRTATQLEALMRLYNQQFRFPLEELDEPLRVRIFADRDRYDAYLRRLIGERRQGFVYLHYRDAAKSELVGYHSEDMSLNQSMIHQGFVQFLRAFIPHPPLWIREGFAVYYERSVYDPDFDTAIYHENLAWLDTLKDIVAGETDRSPIPLGQMLAMTPDAAQEQLDTFYPQAWGMISFFLNAEDPDVNRILWDSLSALDADADLTENVETVYRSAFRWVDQNELTTDFLTYLDGRRSFRGWITHGVAMYEDGDLAAAEQAFVQAIRLEEDNYVPHYYLGLINYRRQNYGLADYYYQEAIATGAEEALTLYALGVNAYADNRFDDAISYLEETVESDPSYRDKAEDLLIRIRG
jgi:tetratricopeptide (TPR) repeat protein